MREERPALVDTVRAAIVAALRAANGNRALAARRLMIGRTTLYRKIRDLDIRPHEYLDPYAHR